MCDSQSIKNQIKVISDIHLEYYTDYNFFQLLNQIQHLFYVY